MFVAYVFICIYRDIVYVYIYILHKYMDNIYIHVSIEIVYIQTDISHITISTRLELLYSRIVKLIPKSGRDKFTKIKHFRKNYMDLRWKFLFSQF